MKYDKQYLYNMYNGTSTDDGKGGLETYENWLERQLISRIELLEQFDLANVRQQSEQLPKRLSNEAYKKANSLRYEEFVEWWDKQV